MAQVGAAALNEGVNNGRLPCWRASFDYLGSDRLETPVAIM